MSKLRARLGPIFLSILLLGFFGLLLIWPMVQVVKTGFVSRTGGLTFAYIRLVFADPALVRGLINATLIAVAVTAATVVLALPLAVLSARYDFPGKGMLNALLLAPLVLPPFVGAIGVRLVLGRYGPLTQLVGGSARYGLGIDWMGHYRVAGIIAVEALHLYPILLLNLQAALANIDPAMEQSAANLGATRWTILRRITLPLLRPGMFAGCTLVLIWSFTELGTPLMFDFYTITPVQVFRQVLEVASNPLPYALVTVMLAASTLLYLLGKVVLGRSFDAATGKANVAVAPRRLRGITAWLATGLFMAIFAAAVLPHVAVILTSFARTGTWYRSLLPTQFTFAHYGQALIDDLAFPSVIRSMQYASLATLLAVAVGLAAAIVIERSDLPVRGLIDALSMLPLAVPGLVLAFGYLALSVACKRRWGERTPFFLDVQEWPVLVLVLAYAVRRLPYIVRSAVAGLEQTPPDLERAAANLGAGHFTVLKKITGPLIGANLVAGALLVFSFSMLEVSDSLLLAQRTSFYPITKAILDLAQRLGDGLYIASALGVWAMLLLTLTILIAQSILAKRMGSVFRL
jgi:iron(III) transport system permease protein